MDKGGIGSKNLMGKGYLFTYPLHVRDIESYPPAAIVDNSSKELVVPQQRIDTTVLTPLHG
jgi:hypothetical protein